MTDGQLIADATRMVSFAMGRGKAPAQSSEYVRMVRRYDTDPEFASAVHAAARGFDCTVLDVDRRSGLILGTTLETEFAVSVTKLVRERTDRPLYLLAHLTIAALAFPSPDNLDDDVFVNRVSVMEVDQQVRTYATAISRRLEGTATDQHAPADQPGLEPLWRSYLRRNATGKLPEADGPPQATTFKLISRAFTHLVDYGFMRKVSDEGKGTYATTVKYRIHIRELASTRLLDDLARLGVAALPSTTASQGTSGTTTTDVIDGTEVEDRHV
ncbi:hypothetical protein OHR68_30290 [Spirillospora sp. NBC_00431]